MKHYAVIGFPISHSRSPEIYEQLFEKYGIEADFSRISVTPYEMERLLSITEALSGFAVTMPHKRAVMRFMDEMTETAKTCGAVNIVERKEGRLIGHNTDGGGAIDALAEAGAEVIGKNVFILGRGGAALSAAHAVKQSGGEAFLLVRGPGRELGFPQLRFEREAISAAPNCDIFINATPLGMVGAEDFSSFEFLEWLKPYAVLDMVYLRHSNTMLIDEAAAHGMRTATGSRMLLMQALRAFRIWTGIEASPEDVVL